MVTTPTAVGFDFTWDTIAEAAIGKHDVDIVVTLIPVDDTGAQGAPQSSASTAIDNNKPTQVAVTTPDGSVSGTVSLDYVLFDGEDDDAAASFTFEVDGGPSGPAGPTATGLPASPTGIAHTLDWDL